MKPLILVFALAAATPAPAAPSPQLTLLVANGLQRYGVEVAPEELTTAQAAALHGLLVSDKSYLYVRRMARAILRNPDFRD